MALKGYVLAALSSCIERSLLPRCHARLKLSPAYFLCALGALFFAGAMAPTQAAPSEILTNAAQLRALGPVQAQARQPVNIRAVFTAVNPLGILFIQDDTGGTFLNFSNGPLPNIALGDVIEVQGVTYRGRYITGIDPVKVHLAGHDKLPTPTPASYDDLLTGRWHYQRVEISGIVHSVRAAPDLNRLILVLAVGPRKLEVLVNGDDLASMSRLVDGRVRVQALAVGDINDRRQLVVPRLLVNQASDVLLEEPPRADPFDSPECALTDLMTFSPAGLSSHRVKVRGVVTYQQSNQAIFLRRAGRGLMIQTAQDGNVRAGDVVEAAGFPAMGRFSAFLEDAAFRVIKQEANPQPWPTTLTEALLGTNDGQPGELGRAIDRSAAIAQRNGPRPAGG
jgi:hypothetical protein